MVTEFASRSEVPPGDRWDLTLLYPSSAAWEEDYAGTQGVPEGVAAYAGRLHESPTVLAEALATWFSARRRVERLYLYAHLVNDEDLANSTAQGMFDRARSLYTRLVSAGSYLAPEVLAIDDATITAWQKEEALRPYAFFLADLLRS